MDILSSIGCCWSIALGFLLHVVPMHQTLSIVFVHEGWGQIFAKSKIGVVHEKIVNGSSFFFVHDSFMNPTCTVHEFVDICCQRSSVATILI